MQSRGIFQKLPKFKGLHALIALANSPQPGTEACQLFPPWHMGFLTLYCPHGEIILIIWICNTLYRTLILDCYVTVGRQSPSPDFKLLLRRVTGADPVALSLVQVSARHRCHKLTYSLQVSSYSL